MCACRVYKGLGIAVLEPRYEIDFPKNSNDRQGGRKLIKPCKRTSSLADLLHKFTMTKVAKVNKTSIDLQDLDYDFDDFIDNSIRKGEYI